MAIEIKEIARGLRLAADGIWYSQGAEQLSYPTTGNDASFAIEDSSFWFHHRNNCIAELARRYRPPVDGPIFDIGGGNGFVALGLIKAGFDAVLVEPGPAGAHNALRRGIEHVICASTDAADFVPESLPAVGLFDVIEHIDDDVTFLQSMRTLLRPDGVLYATVPAYPVLWSDEDVYAGHFRRHTIKSLSRLTSAAGFDVLFASYIFRFLPVPIFLLRAVPSRLGIKRQYASAQAAARDHSASGLGGHLLKALLKSETTTLKAGRRMHFGGSILMAARPRNTAGR